MTSTTSSPHPLAPKPHVPWSRVRPVFLTVFLITVITVTGVTFILPESYAGIARIEVLEGSQNPTTPETTLALITSLDVLEKVVANLDLNRVWGKRYFNGETLTSDQSLTILKTRLMVVHTRETSLFKIIAFSDEPKEAADVANALAVAYQEFADQSAGKAAVQITDRATPSKYPAKPNKTINITLGIIIGAVLGAIMAAFVRWLHVRSGNFTPPVTS